MDKIKALLEKAGCKTELVDQICESLVTYKDTLQEQFKAEQAAKIEEAKKVCIEETEAHKRELARRLQIFCETKSAAIEAQLAKQSALNETEAEARLLSVRRLVEGIDPNGEHNGDVTATLEKAKRQLQVANEEKKRAVEAANRQMEIAQKALRQNRQLATENAQLKRGTGRQVNESRQAPAGQGRRIDNNRRNTTQPTTTRPTLLENQDRRTPAKQTQPNIINAGNPAGYGIADIAEGLDEDLV